MNVYVSPNSGEKKSGERIEEKLGSRNVDLPFILSSKYFLKKLTFSMILNSSCLRLMQSWRYKNRTFRVYVKISEKNF